jgi:hypothetical protein
LTFASPSLASFLKKRTAWICTFIALFTAIVPFARSFFKMEAHYNEGWNVYNTEIVAHHGLLYPTAFGWTTNNYPMLSFYVLAQLHRLTHDYLFTARVLSLLSLIACSILVAAIVHSLGAAHRSSALAGLFCFALFCAAAQVYVGADDPQMFAQVFFLLGLLVYVRGRGSLWNIAAAALLFVIAGFIKHNPVDFPLAVLAELLLLSIPRALWFALCGLALAAAAFALNVHYGGPFFLAQLLTPRTYLPGHLLEQCINVFGPLIFPYCVAAYTAFTVRRDTQRRIALILFITTIVVGVYFSGGRGVSINAFFSSMLAMSILVGLFFDKVFLAQQPPTTSRFATYAPISLFLWLVIPMLLSGNWNPIRTIRDDATAQRHFAQDVAFLRTHPGPALCESMLECYFAGKPYLYDPFNATRLIHFHQLDANVLIDQIRQHRFSAIQTDDPLPNEDHYDSERWDPSVRAAIEANYIPAPAQPDGPTHTNQDIGDVGVVFYIPKPASN